jgi:hypothetical protein
VRLHHEASTVEAPLPYFLYFENNRHWTALQRLGPTETADMPKSNRRHADFQAATVNSAELQLVT